MPREAMEIIEFPWATGDSRTGDVLHTEQHYVRPAASTVSAFCTELTGITPEMVAGAGSLKQAAAAFAAYLGGLRPGSFAVVTHGRWDLEVQLRGEGRAAPRDRGLPPTFTARGSLFSL